MFWFINDSCLYDINHLLKIWNFANSFLSHIIYRILYSINYTEYNIFFIIVGMGLRRQCFTKYSPEHLLRWRHFWWIDIWMDRGSIWASTSVGWSKYYWFFIRRCHGLRRKFLGICRMSFLLWFCFRQLFYNDVYIR